MVCYMVRYWLHVHCCAFLVIRILADFASLRGEVRILPYLFLNVLLVPFTQEDQRQDNMLEYNNFSLA